MTNIEIDWLVYVDTPDWTRGADWRQHISTELRAAWPTLTYEQKWNIAQHANRVPRDAPPSLVVKIRAELDKHGGVTPVDRPDGIASPAGRSLVSQAKDSPLKSTHAVEPNSSLMWRHHRLHPVMASIADTGQAARPPA